MLNIFKLAARNILRNKRRTVLTVSMITIGVVVILFSASFLKSMTEGWKQGLINGTLGHFQVVLKGYKDKTDSFSLDYAIPQASRVVSNLAQEPDVEGVTKKISIGGLVSTGDKTSTFFGNGIEVKSATKALPALYSSIVEGDPLFTEVGGALVAEGLAKNLNVKMGDVLMLATYDKYRAMNAVDVTIRGIVRIPDDSISNHLVITDYQTAQSLVSFGDEATEIIVRTANIDKLDEIVSALEDKYAKSFGVEFIKWIDLSGQLKQVENMFMMFTTIIGLVIYMVVIVGLANTILMSVFERTREIGTLMAMGSSGRHVMGMFIAESVCLATAGIVVGTIIYGILMLTLGKSGIPMAPPGTEQVVYMFPKFSLADVISTGIAIVVVAVIAAVYPSRVASKLNPVDAIRST